MYTGCCVLFFIFVILDYIKVTVSDTAPGRKPESSGFFTSYTSRSFNQQNSTTDFRRDEDSLDDTKSPEDYYLKESNMYIVGSASLNQSSYFDPEDRTDSNVTGITMSPIQESYDMTGSENILSNNSIDQMEDLNYDTQRSDMNNMISNESVYNMISENQESSIPPN
eukprot:UN30482